MKKRVFDVALSGAAVLFSLPMIGTLAAAVALTQKESVMVREKSTGKDGKPFTLYKFRTVSEETNKSGDLLPLAERRSALGAFLQASNLDTLPQLFNVLKGDMSLVGPAPRAYDGADNYIPERYKEVLSVRPGMTGPAQIEAFNKGRALASLERLKLDWDYAAKPQTIVKDVTILARAVSIIAQEPKNNY